MEDFWTYFSVLAPSVVVGLIFWLAMRAIFRADRNERAAEAQARSHLDEVNGSTVQASASDPASGVGEK